MLESFRRLADEEPTRVRLVDASGEKDQVTARLLAELADLVGVVGRPGNGA